MDTVIKKHKKSSMFFLCVKLCMKMITAVFSIILIIELWSHLIYLMLYMFGMFVVLSWIKGLFGMKMDGGWLLQEC